MTELEKRKAYFTFDGEGGNLWYFGMLTRAVGPLTQRKVSAIIDIDSDGCLAGVELIDDMPPLEPIHSQAKETNKWPNNQDT